MPLPPDFINELRNVSSAIFALTLPRAFSTARMHLSIKSKPLGVAFPKTQEDLHAAVELAAKDEFPFCRRGAGTSLAGQAIGKALILDCWLAGSYC